MIVNCNLGNTAVQIHQQNISASPQGYSRFGIGAFANLNPDKTTNRKISGPMALDAKKVELYVCPADKICRAGGMYAHYFVVVYSVNPYL